MKFCTFIIMCNLLQWTYEAIISEKETLSNDSNIPEETFDWSFLDEFHYDSKEDVHHIRKREDYIVDQYSKSCMHTFDVFPDKIIRLVSPYGGKKQYPGGLDCDFELVGTPGCYPAIICETMDLRTSEGCTDDQIIISDGVIGEKVFCGPNMGFSHPFIGKQGKYIFVTFKTGDSTFFDRLYKGFSCKIHCHTSERAAKQVVLPDTEKPRKEEPTLLCGRKFNEGNNRIVGGTAAEKKEFPWQAAIVLHGSRKPFCGATLINNKFILTAAHCVLKNSDDNADTVPPEKIQILLKAYVVEVNERAESAEDQTIAGNEMKDNPEDREEIRLDVEKIFVHRQYNVFESYLAIQKGGLKSSYDSDIALIQLKTALDLKKPEIPTPICLPEATDYNATYDGKTLTVSGWGYTHNKGKYTAKVLQKLEVPTILHKICTEMYGKINIVLTEHMLCAGYVEGGKDACQGDSGGPLILKDGDRWVQVGVVSFGSECAKKNQPGVFVHVAKFVPWLFHKTKGSIWPRAKA